MPPRLACALAIATVFLISLAPCRADRATPFVEENNKLGQVSTAHAYVVTLGPELNTRYFVIVLTDTARPITLQAGAEKGVVKEPLLGREVKVTAEIARAGNEPELKILRVEPLDAGKPAVENKPQR